MRKVITQLFINKFKIRSEIEVLQNVNVFADARSEQEHRKILDAKHEEWDRTEHLISLFFDAYNM